MCVCVMTQTDSSIKRAEGLHFSIKERFHFNFNRSVTQRVLKLRQRQVKFQFRFDFHSVSDPSYEDWVMLSRTWFYFYQGRNVTLIFMFSLSPAPPAPHPILQIAAAPDLPEPGVYQHSQHQSILFFHLKTPEGRLTI